MAIVGTLLTDDNGVPIPQVYDPAQNCFIPIYGSGGSYKVIDANRPENGVYSVQLVGADGQPVASSASGLFVDLVTNQLNDYSFDGTNWRPTSEAKTEILTDGTFSTQTITLSDVWSSGLQNAFLGLIFQGTGKITQIDIKAKMENTYIPYKTLTVELIQGTHLITFGINDAQNNFAIPAEFQIVLTLDSAVSTTLKGIIQLS